MNITILDKCTKSKVVTFYNIYDYDIDDGVLTIYDFYHSCYEFSHVLYFIDY